METDLFSAAAYGEYLSIDDRLKLASFRFSSVINQQDEYGLTMLMEAVRNNRKETVQYLLEHGANPNVVDHNQCSALHYACSDAHSDIIHLLIDHKADVNCRDSKGRTPIHYAEEKNRDGEMNNLYIK
ncbi:hypothetical protein WA171_002695 [Blastocystis sp. BT1]